MKRAAEADLESGNYDVAQISESLLFTVVCLRKEIDPQTAVNNACFPAGTSAGWTVVPKGELPEGWFQEEIPGVQPEITRDTPYPLPCPMHPTTHLHVLAEC